MSSVNVKRLLRMHTHRQVDTRALLFFSSHTHVSVILKAGQVLRNEAILVFTCICCLPQVDRVVTLS